MKTKKKAKNKTKRKVSKPKKAVQKHKLVRKKFTKKIAKKKVSVKKKIVKKFEKKRVEKPVQPTTTDKEAGPRDIRVVNIVVSTSLEHDIPLEKMAATLSNTEYNPEQFPGLVIRIKEPKTFALIFSSGKIVNKGAKTMDKVEESIGKIIKILEKINVKIKVEPEVKIQNIVAA